MIDLSNKYFRTESDEQSNRQYPYTIHDGKRYEGTIHMTEGIGFHDGHGHKIEFR